MRILIVVTLITPTGDYGGPVRVALNHAAALRARGHEVVLAGGARGFDELPEVIDGVPVELFPVRTLIPGTGFAGLSSARLQRWMTGHVREFDVIHIHVARDLVTLPAARIARGAGVPYVLQSHGMIDRSSNPLAIPLDILLTRPLLRAARAVFYLTPRELGDLRDVGGGSLALRELRNGVPISDGPRTPRREVLFLARLAPRKRPQVFVEMAETLAPEFSDVDFVLVGPDEGEGDAISDRIGRGSWGQRLRWEGPINPEAAIDRMRHALIYALPAVDEPYPMSVLEAMSLGIPVVITDTCGLAPVVGETGSGIVTDASLDSFVRAIRGLLSDPDDAAARGSAARRTARELLGMESVVEDLEEAYSVG